MNPETPLSYQPVVPTSPPIDRPRSQPLRRGEPTWATTVVFCCLIMGVLAAWIHSELGLVKAEQNRAHRFETAVTLTEGRDEDLGNLLADPKTHLIELTGPATSPVHFASLAWNEGELRGVLFSDNLPAVAAGTDYLLYGFSALGEKQLLGKLDPKPGVSVYPFRPTDRVGPVTRFELHDGAATTGGVMLSGSAQ